MDQEALDYLKEKEQEAAKEAKMANAIRSLDAADPDDRRVRHRAL